MPGFSSGGNWYGQYFDFVKDGEYTIYGWLNYAEGILWFGIHGLAGAMVFYRVWLTRSESKPGASANESRPAGTPRG